MTSDNAGRSVTQTVPDSQAGADEPHEPRAIGQPRVGRYVVLRKLGSGGMGVVYLAYDAQLDRKIAVKLMNRAIGDREASTARLLREAHALARLSHPNVVQVYEVGEHGEQVYLAMEHLGGVTLREWARAAPRSWRAALAVYTSAGRGLAAAHAAGLIHRDFKPDNAMIDAQGRVRVLDFGLARALDDADDDDPGSLVAGSPELSASLTQAGVVVGTPAYMAPEQHLGAPTDARTDQFALCVALYEALFDQRPFVGEDKQTLAAEVVAGRVREPPRGLAPGWLRRVVMRGLASDRDRRWPSMQALLDALERGQTRARYLAAGVALAVVCAVAGAAWAWQRTDHARRVAACAATGASIEAVWNDAARARVRAALTATGVSYAATVAAKALPWLDRHAAAWSEARGVACTRAGVDGSWDPETLARSLACLDDRRLQLESLIEEFGRADAEVVRQAVQLAAGLEGVQPCLDAALLAQQPRPPAELHGPLRAVQDQLARARNLQGAGKLEAALAAARAARGGAEALEWPSLVAAARLRVGALLAMQGKYAAAEAELEDAYFTALEAGAAIVTAEAAIKLVEIVGARLERPAEAARWARFAAFALRPLERAPGLRTASYHNVLAALRTRAGDYDAALRLYAEVLAIRERLLDPDHPDVAAAHHEVANIERIKHGDEAALARYARVLALRERTLGPDSVELAGTCHNMAILHLELGDHARALAAEQRALAILEQAHGGDHPSVGTCLNTLGNIRRAMGAPDEARALYTRAMAILSHALGPDHSFVASSLYNLGMLDLGAGRPAEARVAMARAVEIRERSPDRLELASTLVGLGRIDLALAEPAAARAGFARALAIAEPIVGPEHPASADALLGLAEVALAERRPDEAAPLATRALAIQQRHGSPEDLALARGVLAAALWDSPAGAGQDRPHARALAEQARDGLRDRDPTALARVERWLAEHPPGEPR